MGDNALHVAASSGFTDIASILIAAGASNSARNSHNERPIDIAKRLGDREIVHVIAEWPECIGYDEAEL